MNEDLQKALDAYWEKFGVPYALFSSDAEDFVADIRKCIAEGKPKEYPEIPDDIVI